MNQIESILKIKPMFGITREKGKYPNWHVFVETTSGLMAKAFPFRKHGGEITALLRAQEYRNSIMPNWVGVNRKRSQKGTIRDHTHGELLNIYREAYGKGCPGWKVQVRFKRKTECKKFYDDNYGGYEGSLKAAQQYRDWLRSLLPGK